MNNKMIGMQIFFHFQTTTTEIKRIEITRIGQK